MSSLDRPSLFRRFLSGLAWVQTRVFVALGFGLVLVPWALLMKLFRADPLAVRRPQPQWHPFETPPADEDHHQY